jgi:streptogramin lyase
VVEVPMISGALSSSAQTVVATGLGSPQGIFADGTGTLYIADSGNKNVLAVPPGEFGEAAAGLTFGSGLTSPSDVAVDNSGNLYITDAGTNQVVKISTEGLQSYVGTGFSFPSGVTVEPGGSIIVADQGNGRIVRIPNEAATLNVADQKVLKSSIASPHSVRMDSAGNLVVADNFANVLDSLNRTAAAISFGNVKDGTSSPAQTITLASTGNIDLGFGSPLFTPLTGDFSLAAGTNPCADGSTLSMGAVCELEATFSPTVGNAENQTVTFAAMGMNAAAFSVTMTGTGSQTSTPTLNVTMDLPSITTTQVLEVTVGASGGSGNPTVTGTITLTSGSYSSGAIALANGSATIDIPAGSLAIGNDTLTIGYAPDSASSLTYNSASKTTPVAVNPAGITTPIMTLTLPSATYNTLQMLTATVSVSGGVGNLVPTGTVTLTSGSYSSAAVSLSKGSANINVNANLLALGSDLVTVSYTPDSASSSTYSSASKSASVNVTPVPAFKLSNAGLIIVAPGANTGNSSLITVTPTYGFTGKINLSCAASGAVICILVKGGSTINSLNISGATPVTAMLLVQTYAGTAKTILPLKDIFLGGGGVSLAGLLFLGFRFRRRDWGVLLGVAILILVCGVAVGCGTNALGKDPGTALGSYTVTVTGTDADTGKVTSSTDVSVTVD